FDVALAIARFGVIFADQPPQCRAHVLVGGGRRNTQRFVKRGSHLFGLARNPCPDAAIFGEIGPRGKVPRARITPHRAVSAHSATFDTPTAIPSGAFRAKEMGRRWATPSLSSAM